MDVCNKIWLSHFRMHVAKHSQFFLKFQELHYLVSWFNCFGKHFEMKNQNNLVTAEHFKLGFDFRVATCILVHL